MKSENSSTDFEARVSEYMHNNSIETLEELLQALNDALANGELSGRAYDHLIGELQD